MSGPVSEKSEGPRRGEQGEAWLEGEARSEHTENGEQMTDEALEWAGNAANSPQPL